MNIYDVRLTDEEPACGMNWPPDLSDVYSFLKVSLPYALDTLDCS
jgi:carboxypeptidase D